LTGNRIAFIGVIILVAGMVLALTVSHLVNSHEYEVNASFSEVSAGKFVSASINMDKSNGILYVSNNTTAVYLVPASDIQIVTVSNVGNYSVQPASGGNVTAQGFAYSLGQPGVLYSNLTGTYNLVSFSTAAPSVVYDRTTAVNHTLLSLYGPLTVGGEAMWIGGTFISAAGFLLLGKKNRK
jgi:hypothetical protein